MGEYRLLQTGKIELSWVNTGLFTHKKELLSGDYSMVVALGIHLHIWGNSWIVGAAHDLWWVMGRT